MTTIAAEWDRQFEIDLTAGIVSDIAILSIRRSRLRYLRTLTQFICLLSLTTTDVFAQEQCISIDNDIQRLQCYDNLFRAPTEIAISPTKAFKQFEDFAVNVTRFDNGQDEYYDFSFRNCILDGIWSKFQAFHSLRNANVYNLNAFNLNLREVQDLKRTTPNRVEVTLSREFPATHARGQTNVAASMNPFQFHSQLKQNWLRSPVTFAWGHKEEVRTIRFGLGVVPEDGTEAYEHFSTLVSACSH